MVKTFTREPDRTEKFWQLVEQQHGKVLAFGIAKYVSSSTEINSKNLKQTSLFWGICYVTEYGIFFYHFPQNSMLGSLLGKKEDSSFCIGIAFEHIEQWQVPNPIPKSWLNRILKKQDSMLSLVGKGYEITLSEKLHSESRGNTNTLSLFKATEVTTKEESNNTHHVFFLDFQENNIINAIKSKVVDKEVR